MVQTRSTTKKLIEEYKNGVEYNGFKIYPLNSDELERLKYQVDEFMKPKIVTEPKYFGENQYTKAEFEAFKELKADTLCNLLDILLAKPTVQKIMRDLPTQSNKAIQVAHRVKNLYVCLVKQYLDKVENTSDILNGTFNKSALAYDLFSKIIKYSDLLLNCRFFNAKFLHTIKNKLLEFIKYESVLYVHVTFKHLFPEFYTDKIKPIYYKKIDFNDGKTLNDYKSDPYYSQVLEKYSDILPKF
jgi:hypothetical protein